MFMLGFLRANMDRNLLVAEPDPLQRQLIDMLLTEDAYAITWVSTGREALDHLKETTPDLVVLKMALPDVTGAEICEKMKRVSRLEHVPVVLMAEGEEGRPIDSDKRALAEAVGADLLLQKPLGDKNLRARLQALLDASANSSRTATAVRTRRRPRSREVDDTIGTLKDRARIDAIELENRTLKERVAELESELSQLESKVAELRTQLEATTETAEAAEATAERVVDDRIEALREQREQGDELDASPTKTRRRSLFNWRKKGD